MSNYLAVATVTGALNYRLSHVVEAAVPGAEVTNLRPNAPAGLPTTGVNIFLYQVTPNLAQRNSDLPTRKSDGTLVKRPTIALDLHYMLSFYGDDSKWQPQILLGSVARSMHEEPSLGSATITAMLGDASQIYEPLALTNLADAPDPVRFTPTALTFEEMSKLWGIFYQIPYVLSVAYVASVVLIEADERPRTALPVRSFQVGAIPLETPVLYAAVSSSNPVLPLSQTDQLILTGVALTGGTSQTVLIDGAPTTAPTATPERYVVDLPATITPGVHTVQLLEQVQVTPSYSSVVESNSKTFAVAPSISSPSSNTTTSPTSIEVDVTATVAPPVGPRQRVQIALVGMAPNSASYLLEAQISSPNTIQATVTAPGAVSPIDAGTYLIRVIVDGVPSALGPDSGPYSSPQVTVS